MRGADCKVSICEKHGRGVRFTAYDCREERRYGIDVDAKLQGEKLVGGKMDDIAIVVAFVG